MKRAAFLAILLVVTSSVHAYTTAKIVGRATHEGGPLAGVAVKIASPSMQETRSTRTDINGRYAFLALPPGDYTVRFEFEGMQAVLARVRAGVEQTARADAEMRESTSEAPAAAEPVAAEVETKGVQTNARASVIDRLPMGRDPHSVVGFAPGTQGGLISGAGNQSSLWMVDGSASVDAFGRPSLVYVEDAIAETTLLSAAIPAEYGRFSGGVVNMITLSGGNEFSGSLRDSLSNPSWTSPSPYQNIENSDHLEQTFEATVGGRVIRDQLWFFVAGRTFTDSIQQFYARSPSWGYTTTNEDRRWQTKLTGNIAGNHTLVASYADRPFSQENWCLRSCAEPSTVAKGREIPASFASVHYSGVLTNRLVAEAFWGQKKEQFTDLGGDSTDQVFGTWGYDARTGARYGAPAFGPLNEERREMTNFGSKATYYLATPSIGTHTIAAGYDQWTSDAIGNNYQSGSNFAIYTFSAQQYGLSPGDVFRPTIAPGDLILWNHLPVLDRPSDQRSHGAFVNDRWDLGAHWSFNLGFRYALNDIVDESGTTVSDTGRLEPRLAAAWDVRGDGRYRVNASYGEYSDLLDVGTGSAAWYGGDPLMFYWEYGGPKIEGLPTFEAFRIVFDWFNTRCDSQGRCGADNPQGMVREGGWGGNTFEGSIDAPLVKEASLGVSFAAGSNGYVRLDTIRREWSRFIVTRLTTGTGQKEDPSGRTVDVAIVENDDQGLERAWDAAMIQAGYALGTRWRFGGSYTWSATKTNVNASLAIQTGPGWYPEMSAFPRNNPVFEDRRSKLRAWAVYGWPTKLGTFDLSVIQKFDSGTPYSVVGGISTAFDPESRAAYASAPQIVNYYFSERGGYRWDDVTSTDIGLRYQLPLFGTGVFVDLAVANVFNESAQVGGDTYVSTRWNASCRQTVDATKRCALFNPFAETPVEGVHYVKSATFGKATSPSHYQTPLTYSFSAGLRF